MSADKPEAEKGLFRFLARLFQDAILVEWKTDAGRMNLFGMLVALILVLVTTAGGFVKWLVEYAFALWGNGPSPAEFNLTETVVIFLGSNLLCVAMLGLLVIFARRSDEKAG